jgi:hypothetical protein
MLGQAFPPYDHTCLWCQWVFYLALIGAKVTRGWCPWRVISKAPRNKKCTDCRYSLGVHLRMLLKLIGLSSSTYLTCWSVEYARPTMTWGLARICRVSRGGRRSKPLVHLADSVLLAPNTNLIDDWSPLQYSQCIILFIIMITWTTII